MPSAFTFPESLVPPPTSTPPTSSPYAMTEALTKRPGLIRRVSRGTQSIKSKFRRNGSNARVLVNRTLPLAMGILLSAIQSGKGHVSLKGMATIPSSTPPTVLLWPPSLPSSTAYNRDIAIFPYSTAMANNISSPYCFATLRSMTPWTHIPKRFQKAAISADARLNLARTRQYGVEPQLYEAIGPPRPQRTQKEQRGAHQQ